MPMKEEYKIKTEPMELSRSDGNRIRGMIFRPDEEDGTFPALIFSHGFGGCYKELERRASSYARSGIVCVLFDFCGGGPASESDGTMLDMTVMTEVSDLEAVMNLIVKKPYVNASSIYLQGESQGGLVSAIVAEKRADSIKGLILWYPAFIIPDDARKRLRSGIHKAFDTEISAEYDTAAINIDINKIQKGYSRPVLILHGDKDDIVPPEYSAAAVRNYRFASIRIINGAGHGFDGTDIEKAEMMSIQFIMVNETLRADAGRLRI